MPPKLGDNMSAEAQLRHKANATQEAAKIMQPPQIAALQNALRNALEQNKRQIKEREEHFKRLKQQHQAEFQPKFNLDEEYGRILKAQNWTRKEIQEAEQAKLREEERERREALRQHMEKSKGLPPGSVVTLPDQNMDLNEVSQFFSVTTDHLKKIASKLMPPPDIDALRIALANALEHNKRQIKEQEEHFKRLKQQHQAEFLPKFDMDTRPSWRTDEEYERAFKEQNWKRKEMQEAEQAKIRQEERERREALRRH